jgi:hypothetical protein
VSRIYIIDINRSPTALRGKSPAQPMRQRLLGVSRYAEIARCPFHATIDPDQ